MFIFDPNECSTRWQTLALPCIVLGKLLLAPFIPDVQAASRDVRYNVLNLSERLADSFASTAGAINQHGDVVLLSSTEDNFWCLFIYTDAEGPKEITDVPRAGRTTASSINNKNQLSMSVYPSAEEPIRPFRYTPGQGFLLLGNFGKLDTIARDINNSGQVVGFSQDVGHAFRYTDGAGFEDLGELFPGRESEAWSINDQGWVAGAGGGPGGGPPHAFLYTDERGMIDLGQGWGRAINNRGAVAGYTGERQFEFEACLFINGEIRRLGSFGGDSFATDVNDYNVVVGSGLLGQNFPTKNVPFIWSEAEGMRRLQDLVDVDRDWILGSPTAINNAGQMVGTGNYQFRQVGYRLDPIPPKLAITPTPTNLTVSWSPAWPGLVLEASESLTAQDWQPLDTGGTNVVALPMEPRRRFFRLNLEGIRGLCCAPE